MTHLNLQGRVGQAILAMGLLLNTGLLYAQQDRDPTVPPPENTATTPLPAGVEGMTVMVRDGKPYLVVGTRWYATGDKIGLMRVDRITETEVWLHDGTALLKIPRFAGIERTVSKTKPVCDTQASAAIAAPASVPTADSPPARTVKASKRKAKPPENTPSAPADAAQNLLTTAAPCEDNPL